jgi:polygalacturonase
MLRAALLCAAALAAAAPTTSGTVFASAAAATTTSGTVFASAAAAATTTSGTVFASAPATSATTSGTVFDIRSYGAVNDGTTLNTVAIAKAIAAASSTPPPSGSSANTVLVSGGGAYLSGQVRLLSHVHLLVDENTTLLASANVTDYPTDEDDWAFVFAEGQVDLAIQGAGTIDGQQPLYIGGWAGPDDKFIPAGWNPSTCSGECRPRLVRLRNCSEILMTDVLLTHSPDWTCHLEASRNILVQRLRQYGDSRWPNNDGIDIDSSQNVTILDSSFDTADDGVCIKSTAGFGLTRDVVVRNTTIRSRSGAIKFGSNTDTNCTNLLFENITIYDSNRGLAIQQRSQGNVTDVVFRDITVETRYNPPSWWGSAEPLYISSMPRAPGGVVGGVYNITFERITARAENGALFSGLHPGTVLQGVTVRNVSIVLDKWSNYSYPAHSYVPTTCVPDLVVPPAMHVEGIYIEAANGVVLENVNVSWVGAHAQPYWGRTCFNTTNAGFPVTVTGSTCGTW